MIYAIGTGAKFFAAISIQYSPGAICVCSKDNYSYTAVDAGTDGTWDYYTFLVPEAGTWTITLTKGTNSKQVTATVSEQYESVYLERENFRLYLWNKGSYDPITGGFSWDTSDGNVGIWVQSSDYNNSASFKTKNSMNLSRYSTLTFNLVVNESMKATPGQRPYRTIGLSDDEGWIISKQYNYGDNILGNVSFDLTTVLDRLDEAILKFSARSGGGLIAGTRHYNYSSIFADQIWVE